MTLILADVGGTNVRFATVDEASTAPTRIKRFRNDDYAHFDDALTAYLAWAAPGVVSTLSIAVAGPVTGKRARLTNRGWQFDADDLAASHAFESVFLLNDLSALGYSVDVLGEDGVAPVLQAEAYTGPMMQRLVIGVGTGLNVSPVLSVDGRTVCLLAEAGLGSLPLRVEQVMERYLGGPAPWVRCAEDAVRGPGLAELHAAATGLPKIDTREIFEAADAGDPQALASVRVFAEMLGELVHDLRLLYMPTGGIFLAGSVMRGLLDSPERATFIETISAQPSVKSTLAPVPVSLITQDEAALFGCLAYARIMEAAPS